MMADKISEYAGENSRWTDTSVGWRGRESLLVSSCARITAPPVKANDHGEGGTRQVLSRRLDGGDVAFRSRVDALRSGVGTIISSPHQADSLG